MFQQETLTKGFGEGSEDAKQIAKHIDGFRQEMQPLYDFMDEIVMRVAWNPDFYKDVQRDITDYRGVDYNTAFQMWRNAFRAKWPNLLTQPEEEKLKGEKARFECVTAMIEVLAPLVQDPKNRAKLVMWAQDCANNREELFEAKLDLDQDELESFQPPPSVVDDNDQEEPKAKPFRVDAVTELGRVRRAKGR